MSDTVLGPYVLPGVLHWIDEIWSPVVATETLSLTGAPLIQRSTRSGRPITLTGQYGGEDLCLVPRATVLALAAALDAATPETPLRLRLRDGREFDAIGRHTDGGPVAAEPWWYADLVQRGDAADYVITALRLMEV